MNNNHLYNSFSDFFGFCRPNLDDIKDDEIRTNLETKFRQILDS